MKINKIHILYNFEMGRVLAATPNISAINALIENSVNSRPFYFAGQQQSLIDRKTQLIPANFDVHCPWNFKYNKDLGIFQQDIIENPSEDIMMFQAKVRTLTELNIEVNDIRRPFCSSYDNQGEIYLTKLQQAKEFLSLSDKSKIDQDDYVFVKDYAKISKVDMNIAAREIISQDNFKNKRLSFSENIRIKYTKAIVNSKSFRNLDAVYKELKKEIWFHYNF